jgi:hypothetical protein
MWCGSGWRCKWLWRQAGHAWHAWCNKMAVQLGPDWHAATSVASACSKSGDSTACAQARSYQFIGRERSYKVRSFIIMCSKILSIFVFSFFTSKCVLFGNMRNLEISKYHRTRFSSTLKMIVSKLPSFFLARVTKLRIVIIIIHCPRCTARDFPIPN